MWFRILSILIGTALVGKSVIALVAPKRFYGARQRQYSSPAMPRKLLAGPMIVAAMTAASFYATIYHYVAWGWIVTTFLTGLLIMAIDHLFRWARHREAMLRVVGSPKVRRVDWCLLALGAGFLNLGVFVY